MTNTLAFVLFNLTCFVIGFALARYMTQTQNDLPTEKYTIKFIFFLVLVWGLTLHMYSTTL